MYQERALLWPATEILRSLSAQHDPDTCLVSTPMQDSGVASGGETGTGSLDSRFLHGPSSHKASLSLQGSHKGSGHHMNSEKRKETQGGSRYLLTEDGKDPAKDGKTEQTPKGRDPGTPISATHPHLCNPPPENVKWSLAYNICLVKFGR